jgi:hypothetical protein
LVVNPIVILGIVCAFLLAAVVGEGYVIAGKNDTIAAKERELGIVAKDRDAQLDGLNTAKAALKRQQERMDETDAQARASLQQQQASARDLAVRLQSATDLKNAAIAQLQEEIDARPSARPETFTVSVYAPDGWDPVVVAGMRRLRCLQLAAAGHQDAADCRVPAENDAGRSGLAGDPAGAAYPRPSARQQLDFLAFAWSLREWGASCYDDKRAIAAAQEIKP